MSLFNIFDISGSAMLAQSQKIKIHASNLANSESLIEKNGHLYPYIAKQAILKFDSSNADNNIGGVKIEKIINNPAPLKSVYNPNSPIANSKGFAKISNVDLVTETVSAISASRNYEINLEVLNTIKHMIIKTLSIGQ